MGTASRNSGAAVGFEAGLWKTIDILRGSMDAAEYKHVVNGPARLSALHRVDFSGEPRGLENFNPEPASS